MPEIISVPVEAYTVYELKKLFNSATENHLPGTWLIRKPNDPRPTFAINLTPSMLSDNEETWYRLRVEDFELLQPVYPDEVLPEGYSWKGNFIHSNNAYGWTISVASEGVRGTSSQAHPPGIYQAAVARYQRLYGNSNENT